MERFPSGQREQTVNLLSVTSVVRIHPSPPYKKQRFDTKVLNLFSLHKGSSFLSVSEHQNLVGVFNRTFCRVLFLYNK